MMILQQTRGVLSSGDGLALDLPFAETKSLTARVGPTPSFSRTSGGTYVGSDGLIHGVDTSTTSNSINTGTKTFTLVASANQNQMWKVGDAVEVVNSTSNFMVGTVTSYTPSTQALICNITSVTGSGTFNSWRIGYRGPRFDHDPVTRHCKGLLVEERRDNLLLQSEGFSTGSWAKPGSTVTANSIVSPNGSVTANLLFTEDSGLSTHAIQQGVPSLTAGQPYTFSVFAKAASHTSFQLTPSVTAFGGGMFANFVLSGSGSVGTSSGVTASIQSYSNGWYRCSVTVASVTGGSGGFAVIVANNNDSSSARVPSYQGTGAQVVYIWGAQLELGRFATSYIPTTTASLIRSPDLCNITGAAFNSFYNQLEGTIFSQAFSLTRDINPFILHISDGSYSNAMDLRFNSNNIGNTSALINNNNIFQAGFGRGISSTTNPKSILAYKFNDTAFTVNGESASIDTNIIVPTVNRLQIGAAVDGSALNINGAIAAIRYYKRRLPNAKLQPLTRFAPDIDAHNYIVSLFAAGANVTPKQQNAINTFITTGKYEGWYPLLKRFYLPLWGAAVPNAIDLVTRTSGSFVGSITHGAGFVKANDSTGYFDFGVSPQALGLTQFDAGLMGWVDIEGGNVELVGTVESDISTFTLRTADGQPNINFTCFDRYSDAGRLTVLMSTIGVDARSGIITGYGYDGSLSIYRRLGTSRIVVGSEVRVGSGTPPTTNIRAMGSSGLGLATRTRNCYAFAAMKGMSNSMDEKFTAAVNQFRTNMLS